MNAITDMTHNFIGGARRLVGKVPFLRDAVAMYFCMVDRGTPLWAKAAIASALAYLLMPMDAIPDALPGIGFGDDAGTITLALKQVIGCMTEDHYYHADQFFGYCEDGHYDD